MTEFSRFLRTIVAIVLATLITSTVSAAVPQLIPYQGMLTDGAGDPVTDGGHLVKFIIYDASVAGADLWNSGFQNVTTTNGLFSYDLGSIVGLPDDLFTDSSRYLSITVGGDPEISPRTRLETAPYAYHSLRADSADYAAKADLLGSLGPADVALSVHNHAGTYSETSHTHDADITAVNAGTGMTGGGASGSVTLNADDTYLQKRVIGTAAPGSAIVQINQDGGVVTEPFGDITAVNAGAGLNGGGSSGSVSLNIANSGVTGAMIAGGTITGADIALSTISGSHLTPNTVGQGEIATNGVASAEILDGSVFDLDIADEPGIAFSRKTTSTGLTASSTAQDILTVNITTPTSGLVVVEGNAYFRHSGTTGFCFGWVQIDLTSGGGLISNYYQWTNGFAIANTSAGYNFSESTVRRVYSLTAGNYTFRMEGNAFNGNSVGALVQAYAGSTLSAIFYPTAYGAVSLDPPVSPENPSPEELNPSPFPPGYSPEETQQDTPGQN